MSSNIQPFKIKTSPSEDESDNTTSLTVQIGELPGIVAENLGLATWGASIILADVLHRWTPQIHSTITSNPSLNTPDPTKHIPVLELGAGTGLAGLAAAALWKLPAILTDLQAVVPGIEYNMSLNPSLKNIRAGSLDWNSPSTLTLPPTTPTTTTTTTQPRLTLSSAQTKTSLLLAADTIYTPSHAHLIPRVTTHWLDHTPTSLAIFCYPLRSAYIDHARGLWQEMQATGFVCVEEGRVEPRELWGEIAPVPYEWCAWGWREFHAEAVRREEEEAREMREAGSGWLAM